MYKEDIVSRYVLLIFNQYVFFCGVKILRSFIIYLVPQPCAYTLAANLAAASLVFLYLNTLQTRATRIPYRTTRRILEARRQYVTTLGSFVC